MNESENENKNEIKMNRAIDVNNKDKQYEIIKIKFQLNRCSTKFPNNFHLLYKTNKS